MCLLFLLVTMISSTAYARTYDVGPGREFANIGDVPWEVLAPGDVVQIHWRTDPYHEKWVICARGTAEQPIVVRGIAGADGSLPVIDGRNATMRRQLNYWNEPRGIIKIGGANVPADTMPAHIVVENLDIRSGRPPHTFTGRNGLTAYAKNSAAIFVEKGEHITIRNCIMRDCGNGFFCASQSSNVLIESCHIYDNGIEDSIYEHNSYTEARGITFQFNHYGPLRDGCRGNNLKDRSAGTVIRYNWIEDGNRQLDLVDTGSLMDDPAYRAAYVYGNILIEGEGQGNSQIVHYGGDSGDLSRYRKGTLYFYNNTIVSTRTDNTTLFRLSSLEETCDMRNNIVYVTAPGERMAISNDAGVIDMRHNWIKTGWVASRGAQTVYDRGGNLSGEQPGFIDITAQRFELRPDAPAIDAGIDPGFEPHPVLQEYVPHRQSRPRITLRQIDLGAYEYPDADFDGSGQIDFPDFILFASAFGKTARDPDWNTRFDLTGDGTAGFGDFLIFAHLYGRRGKTSADDGKNSHGSRVAGQGSKPQAAGRGGWGLATFDSRLIWWTMEKAMIPIIDAFKS